MIQSQSRWQILLPFLPLLACLTMWAAFWLALFFISLLGRSVAGEKQMLFPLGIIASTSLLARGIAILASGGSRFGGLAAGGAMGVTAAFVTVVLAAHRGNAYGLLPVLGFVVVFIAAGVFIEHRART